MSSYFPPVPALGADGDVPQIPDIPDMPDAGSSKSFSGQGSRVLDFGGLVTSLSKASGSLERAQKAEANYANGTGSLMESVVERAKADTYLTVAASAASKASQSISTLMNMQV